MPTPHLMHYAGCPLRIYQFFDGQLWFDCRDVARLLGYPDAQKAVRSYCRGSGLRPGVEEGTVRLIDLTDTLRLLIHSPSEKAAAFEEWLRGDCLKLFFCRIVPAREGEVRVDSKPLARLRWRDQYWVKLVDVAEALGPRLRF